MGLVGRGKVARAMVEVIRAQADMLYGRFGTEFHLRAAMDSSKMVLSEALDLTDLDAVFQEGAPNVAPADLKAFTAHVKADHLPHAIIIDCSDSEDVAQEHPGWLEQNIHVVTANKKGLCGSMSLYNAILRQRKVRKGCVPSTEETIHRTSIPSIHPHPPKTNRSSSTTTCTR